MIISYILIALAAICNAFMDRTGDIVAFNKSVFQHHDPKFWCKEVSWLTAKKFFGWKADAWHIAKSLMIILFALAVILHKSTFNWFIELLTIGIIWNLTFNLFYNKIFKQ